MRKRLAGPRMAVVGAPRARGFSRRAPQGDRMHRQIRAIAVVLSIIAVASCGESPTGPGLPYVPSWQISDGAHMHGNPHFYFLPPMVPQPAYRGTPDASLAPTVLVCEFTSGCDKVIARFTTTSGTGSELVRYDAASQQYIVNW